MSPSRNQRVSHSQSQQRLADIITYRLESKMVYVPRTLDYQKAITYARQEFAELGSVARERISFSMNVSVHGKISSVRVAEVAWPTVAANFHRYEIVDVRVQPVVTVQDVDANGIPMPPPRYLEEPGSENNHYTRGKSCPPSGDSRRMSPPMQSVASEQRGRRSHNWLRHFWFRDDSAL